MPEVLLRSSAKLRGSGSQLLLWDWSRFRDAFKNRMLASEMLGPSMLRAWPQGVVSAAVMCVYSSASGCNSEKEWSGALMNWISPGPAVRSRTRELSDCPEVTLLLAWR